MIHFRFLSGWGDGGMVVPMLGFFGEVTHAPDLRGR